MHELLGDGLAQVGQHRLEQVEALRLVLVERIALAVAAEMDHLAQVLERDEVLAPQVVQGLQQDHLLDLADLQAADRLGRFIGSTLDVRHEFARLGMLAIELETDSAQPAWPPSGLPLASTMSGRDAS